MLFQEFNSGSKYLEQSAGFGSAIHKPHCSDRPKASFSTSSQEKLKAGKSYFYTCFTR